MSLTKQFSPTGVGSAEDVWVDFPPQVELELELDGLEWELNWAMINYSREHGDQALIDYVETWLWEKGVKR